MRLLLVTMIGLCAAATCTWGANMLPPGGTGVTEEVQATLDRVSPDQEYVLIDDMLFQVEELRGRGYVGDPWPDGVVYYSFHENVNTLNRERWREAAGFWDAVANLTFVEAGTGDAILIESGDENSSTVGYHAFGNHMTIVSWGMPFVIAHEIGHALGFVHEHTRSDRDAYVWINWDFIQEDHDHNFEIDGDTANLGPYDFDSVMHYSGCAFSTDCPDGAGCDCTNYTIVCQPGHENWQDLMGQRDHLSQWDAWGMASVYGAACDGENFVQSGASAPWDGSHSNPWPSIGVALTMVCPGADLFLFQGTYPEAPLTINQEVALMEHDGFVVIE